MKTIITTAAALAFLAGVSVASAQVGGMPAGTGAGSAGQDQRPSDQELPNAAKRQPSTMDAPRGQEMESNRRTRSNMDVDGMAPSAPAGDDRSNGPRH
jgi:hypothetical protein